MKFYLTNLFTFSFVTLISISCANAFCYKPSFYKTVPTVPGSFARPSPPYCLFGYKLSGTHTCDEWEIQNYINESNNYIAKLNSYASEAGDFARSAQRFVDDAYSYAKCEADDVKSELR